MIMSTSYVLILLFAKYTAAYNLPPGLVSALCYEESHHKIKVVNPKDGLLRNGRRGDEHSIGVCQLKLKTAQQFEPSITYKQLLRPENNIRIASKYLRWQIDRYQGDFIQGIAAYNAGKARYNKYGRLKNRKYVEKVMRSWVAYR